MKYGLRRKHMEQKYSVRIVIVTHKDGDTYFTNAGVWIGESWVDETLLFNASGNAPSKAASVIASLDALEPRLEDRWRRAHYDSQGQYYMFGVAPRSAELS